MFLNGAVINDFSSLPLLDDEQIQMLIDTGEDGAIELMQELLELYVQESQPLIDVLLEQVNAEDPAAARSAHAIAGSSANFGVLRMSCLARQIETVTKEGRFDQARSLSADLKPVYDASLEAVRNTIGNL